MKENVANGKHQTMLESACYLLSYIADIVCAIKQTGDHQAGVLSPPYDGDATVTDTDIDWAEDIAPEEEDSAAEDSVSKSHFRLATAEGKRGMWMLIFQTGKTQGILS